MAVDALARALAAGKVPVSAYEMAVKAGYTGTEEQFAEDMGNSGTNAANAAASASAAAASAESVSASAAQIATNTNDISDLKTQFALVSDTIYPTKLGRYGVFNSEKILYWSQTSQQIIYIECEEETTYVISKTLGDSFLIGCTVTIPAAGVAIEGFYDNVDSIGTVEYTTPANAKYLLVHCSTNNSTVTREELLADVKIYSITGAKDNKARSDYDNLSDIVEALNDTVDTNSDDINEIQHIINDVIETNNIHETTQSDIIPSFTIGAINETGKEFPAYTSFNYTQKISVVKDDIISVLNTSDNPVQMRWICAYNGNAVISESGAADDRKSYLVPDGVDGVIITTRIVSNASTIRISHTEETTESYVKPIPLGFMSAEASLNSGDRITLPFNNVKNKNRFIFNTQITTFDSVIIGKGGNTIKVDSDNITITNDQTTKTFTHGLTINHDLSVIFGNDESTYLSVLKVYSAGNVYVADIDESDNNKRVRFIMDSSAAYAESDGSVLTDCKFSWVSENINAPIWLFGDSYFNWYSSMGWPWYAAEDNNLKNAMLNGFAGQKSSSAYTALLNLLDITTPKIVVWCLGMNDPDNETAYQAATAVNPSWKNYIDNIIELEKKYGFELILYTTPTTPKWKNNYKNEIVRNSGHRYIEADNAVRINENGDWVSGALNLTDETHATALGAKIIYCRFLADLPELMSNY